MRRAETRAAGGSDALSALARAQAEPEPSALAPPGLAHNERLEDAVLDRGAAQQPEVPPTLGDRHVRRVGREGRLDPPLRGPVALEVLAPQHRREQLAQPDDIDAVVRRLRLLAEVGGEELLLGQLVALAEVGEGEVSSSPAWPQTCSASPAGRCSTRSCPALVTPRCWPTSHAGKLRKKLPALKQALAGNFKPHHSLIVSHILAHLDYLDEGRHAHRGGRAAARPFRAQG